MHIFSSWVIEDSLGEAQCEQMASAAGESTCWVVHGAWEPPLVAMLVSTLILETMLGGTVKLVSQEADAGSEVEYTAVAPGEGGGALSAHQGESVCIGVV